MKRHYKSFATQTLLTVIGMLVSLSARAEGVRVTLVPLPSVTYDATGVPVEPASVRTSLAQGGMDPGLQLALQHYLIGECVEKVLSEGPTQKTSYKSAYQKFATGACTLARCFQRGMVLDFLAQSSPNPENGGNEDPAVQEAMKGISESLNKKLAENGCGNKN